MSDPYRTPGKRDDYPTPEDETWSEHLLEMNRIMNGITRDAASNYARLYVRVQAELLRRSK